MKSSKKPFSKSRRGFLRGAATVVGAAGASSLGFFGSDLMAPSVVGAAPLMAHKRLIVLDFAGGNDGLNMVIPNTLSRYFDRRPTIAVDSNASLSLTGGPGNNMYRLHPAMTGSRDLWNQGEMAMVNQVGYPNRNLSHFVSQDVWSFGIRGNVGNAAGLSGWIARYADLYAPTPTGIVSVGAGRPNSFFGGNTSPLMVGSLSGFNINVDWRHRNDHAYRQDIVQDVVANGSWNSDGLSASATAIAQSYDLSGEIQAAIDSYSSTVEYKEETPSRAFRDIARLIQAGFDTQIFFAKLGGFDTHSGQGSRHMSLLQRVDSAISDFAADLKAMGVWQDTVIVVSSEFGRRHEENGSNGTDHGHGNCVLLYGGGLSGGVYGPDHTNEDIDLKYGDYKVDFRTIYRDIVENHLGVDPDPVFPEAAEISDSPGGLIA